MQLQIFIISIYLITSSLSWVNIYGYKCFSNRLGLRTGLGMQDNKLNNMQEPRSLPSMEQKKILGLGVACIDMITCVDIYPKQDEKILAKSIGIYSGGNVGNTLTTISLLKAASATIFTRIGDDSNGKFFLDDLQRVGVDVTHVLTSAFPTRFVYVLVDKQGCRTCIASPNEQEMTVSEVNNAVYTDRNNDHISGLLENVELLHLDSRHTAAAVVLAREANMRGIPVSLDVEKDRLHLAELLPLCDMIFTNKEFPENFFAQELIAAENIAKEIRDGTIQSLEDELLPVLRAMTYLFSTSSNAGELNSPQIGDYRSISDSTVNCRTNFVVTTRGSLGSLLMRKRNKRNDSKNNIGNSIDNIQPESNENGGTGEDLVIEKLLTDSPILMKKFVYNRSLNRIIEAGLDLSSEAGCEEVEFDIISCAVLPLTPDQIVDSTGAGDAYIGGFLTGWAQGFSDENCMKLGTTVAAIKIGHKGARGGLPNPGELNEKLRSLITNR